MWLITHHWLDLINYNCIMICGFGLRAIVDDRLFLAWQYNFGRGLKKAWLFELSLLLEVCISGSSVCLRVVRLSWVACQMRGSTLTCLSVLWTVCVLTTHHHHRPPSQRKASAKDCGTKDQPRNSNPGAAPTNKWFIQPKCCTSMAINVCKVPAQMPTGPNARIASQPVRPPRL